MHQLVAETLVLFRKSHPKLNCMSEDERKQSFSIKMQILCTNNKSFSYQIFSVNVMSVAIIIRIICPSRQWLISQILDLHQVVYLNGRD